MIVQECPFVTSMTIVTVAILNIVPPDPYLDWALICSVVPYIILLAILNYRAAYHRKLWKLKDSENDTRYDSKFQTYIRELILVDTKMAPVSSPVVSGIWGALCYIVFWILYPRPISACHGFIEGMLIF
jgi:hypothetical protein